jgi:hypothetical protein
MNATCNDTTDVSVKNQQVLDFVSEIPEEGKDRTKHVRVVTGKLMSVTWAFVWLYKSIF